MITDNFLLSNRISSFIGNYISTTTSGVFIDSKHQFDSVLITLCERARSIKQFDIYYTNQVEQYDFARQITLPDSIDEKLEFLHDYDLISLSSLTIDRGLFERKFNKYKDACDLYPFLGLYSSEVISLGRFLGCNMQDEPSTLIEYCHKQDLKNSIISSEKLPTQHQDWFKYTKDQKDYIAYLHQRVKKTSHKDLGHQNYPRVEDLRV